MKSRKLLPLLALVIILTIATGAAYAQNSGDYTVGYFLWWTGAFINEMTALGYIDGENITYLSMSYEGFDTMTPEEAAESMAQQTQAIIDAHPDVIVINTDTDAVNMRAMAGDIPIVFARSDDPVATGAVEDLIRPGGNTTGIITNQHHERRLQLLVEILPSTDAVYYLYSPLTAEAETVFERVRAVGEELGVDVIPAQVPDLESGLEALANAPEEIDWLFLTPYVPYDLEFSEALIALSLERQIGIAGITGTPTQGYAIGYGPSIDETDAQAARIVDRIFRGADPSALPVQIAENHLAVNLEAAEAIGLDIPLGILRQADIIVRPGDFATPEATEE